MCRTDSGIVFSKRNVKINQEGSQDMHTGEKFAPVRKEDIVMGQILGRGNGGFVYQGFHKQSKIEVAVKVILFDSADLNTGHQLVQQRAKAPVLQWIRYDSAVLSRARKFIYLGNICR